jgi:hypothetical protein
MLHALCLVDDDATMRFLRTSLHAHTFACLPSLRRGGQITGGGGGAGVGGAGNVATGGAGGAGVGGAGGAATGR